MNVDEFLLRYAAAERNFPDIDLSYVDLQEANLVNLNLTGANLSSADLNNKSLNIIPLICYGTMHLYITLLYTSYIIYYLLYN